MQYFNLGEHSRPITTSSPQAQLWFDRGLVWTYAYNHEEAIVCFQKALSADPNCAMAHWGIAYAIGPNYNKPWDTFEDDEKKDALKLAQTSVNKAVALSADATPGERAICEAIASRYPTDPNEQVFDPWNDRFADAMRAVYKAHSDDLDICCLFAEAMMNRTPWALWDLPSGKPAKGADTLEIVAVLEQSFEQIKDAWNHPGLLHMYIHTMEMSPHPQKALRHGDRLVTLVPDAGHLVHMATHIDVLCGDYHNVVARNHAAIIADNKYLDHAGSENFYSIYRCHNYHFKIYGAMFLGQPAVALATADDLIKNLPVETLAPMADWFEAFVPMKQHVMIRFGLWQDILAQSLPEDQELYSSTTAMMHYARTVALANLRELEQARRERDVFFKAQDRVQASRMLFNNSCRDILKVAEQMLLGELAYKSQKPEAAFGHLRRSVELDDNLPYDEPWGWMQPTRHALGALLLDQKEYDEAESVYRADLGLDKTLSRACQHPQNVWSLHGLHECLIERGETVESALIGLQLEKALARSDVPVRASCYCRQMSAN